jgi:hypothetical protein
MTAKTFVTVACLTLFSVLAYIGFSAYQRYLLEARCDEMLQDAMRKADAVADARASEFGQFIEGRSSGVKPFSEELVSVAGSMTVIECKLPGAAEDCFQLYVVKKFGEHLFTQSALEGALKRAFAGGAQDIEMIENQLAVALHQEILGRKFGAEQQTSVETEFKRAAETLRVATDKDIATSAVGLVVTEFATYLGTQMLIRLGVSGGMLAAGVANSWWTFGGSLALGVALNELWTHMTQPAVTVENELRRELGKIALSGRTTIHTELGKAVIARKASWQTAVKGMMQ